MNALSGLAKSLGPPVEYCAGLWARHLCYQLLWRSTKPLSSRRAYETGPECQAPSWSWASVNGPVRYRIPWQTNNPLTEISIQVLDTRVPPSTFDPTGPVKFGMLRVHGSLARVKLSRPSSPSDTYIKLNSIQGSVTWNAGSFDETRQYYCLPIELKETRHSLMVGIVLEPASPSVRGEFFRLGYFSVADDKNEDRFRTFAAGFRDEDFSPGKDVVESRKDPAQGMGKAVDWKWNAWVFTIV